MEVTEDNDYDCFPHYIPSNQEDKVLFGAKKTEKSEEILSVNDDKTQSDSMPDNDSTIEVAKDANVIDSKKENNEDETGSNSNSDSSDSETDSENYTQVNVDNKVEDERVITKSLAGGILMSFIPHEETSNDENDSLSIKEKPNISCEKKDVYEIHKERLHKVKAEAKKNIEKTNTEYVLDTTESNKDLAKEKASPNNSENFPREPIEKVSDSKTSLDENNLKVDLPNSELMKNIDKIKDLEAKHSSEITNSGLDTRSKNHNKNVNDSSDPKAKVKDVSSLDQQIEDIEKACNAFKEEDNDLNTKDISADTGNESNENSEHSSNEKASTSLETNVVEPTKEIIETSVSKEDKLQIAACKKEETSHDKLENKDDLNSQEVKESSGSQEMSSNKPKEYTEMDNEMPYDKIDKSPEKENIEESIIEISNFINANPLPSTSNESDHKVKCEPIEASPLKPSKSSVFVPVTSINNSSDKQKISEIKSEPGLENTTVKTSNKQKSIFDLSTSNESLPEPIVNSQSAAKQSRLSLTFEQQQSPVASASRILQRVVDLSSSKDDTDDEIEVLFEQKPSTIHDKDKSKSPTYNKELSGTFRSRMGKYHIPKKRPGSSSSQESDIQIEQPRRSVDLKQEPALGDVKLLSRTASDAQPLSTSPVKKEKCALCSQVFVSVEQLYIHLGREHFKVNIVLCKHKYSMLVTYLCL